MTLRDFITEHKLENVNLRFKPNTPGIGNRNYLFCSLQRVNNAQDSVLVTDGKYFSKIFSFNELAEIDSYISYVLIVKGFQK